MSKILVQELTWKEARKEVHHLNPSLAQAIDSIDGADNKKLFKARYNFGDLILNNGIVQFPNALGECIPLNHHDCAHFAKKLSYSSIPLGLVLHKGVEIFVDSFNYITPLNMLTPGKLFGLFEVMDRKYDNPVTPVWSITAGARSTFFLPKVADRMGHERLRRIFSIPTDPPRKLIDQWKTFKGIAQSSEIKSEWYSEILFFTDEWFNNIESNNFKLYLNELAWQQSRYARQQIILSLMWKSLALEISRRNLKTRAYIIDTLKHLISISAKSVPGFNVAIDDLYLPHRQIQQAYIDQYLLKEYLPTIMIPVMLGANKDCEKVYYSLSKPTLLEGAPDERDNTPSIVTDLREIKKAYQLFKKSNHLDGLKISADKVNYMFYHIEPNEADSIHLSSLLPKENPIFLADQELFKGREFCSSATFLRGCIQVS